MNMQQNTTDFNIHNANFKFFDPDDSIAKETMPGKIYEPGVTSILIDVIKNAKCFLDIGAHYGYFSCLVGKLNNSCAVHAFEPGAAHISIFDHNILINGVTAKLHKVALSDRNGNAAFKGRTLTKEIENIESVEEIIFDDWCANNNVRADIAKIDVHGAEGKVLYGMKKALTNDIKHLLIEIHASHLLLDYSYKEILSVLKETGFRIYELVDFRENENAQSVELTGTAYDNFVDPKKWTEYQIKNERMIYATK